MIKKLAFLQAIIKGKFQQFLLKQSTISPILFFIALYLSQANPLNSTIQIVLFFFSINLLLFRSFNVLYLLTPFLIVQSTILALILFVICSLGCTRKWKAYIFLFKIGHELMIFTQVSEYYIVLASIFLCWVTYNSFIFSNINANKQFFIGFFTTSAYFGCKVALYLNGIALQQKYVYSILILLMGYILGKTIIQNRIQNIRNTSFAKLKDSRILAHCLKLSQDDITYLPLLNIKLQQHANSCNSVYCFCKNINSYHDKKNQLQHRLYKQALNAASKQEDTLLWQYYIQFLIENKEIIYALYQVSIARSTSYFSVISIRRMEAKIKNYLTDVTSHLKYQKQYIFALDYDEKHLKLALMIHDILKAKISFWSQANRETPLFIRLQKLGAYIVRQMYVTNVYFCSQIRQYEQYLNIFDSTVMYGMYLLSTTNFKDYSQTVIKNTSKRLQQIQIYDSNSTQTYVIRAVAQSKQKTFTMTQQNLLTDLYSQELQRKKLINVTRDYNLVIDSVSNGFCKLINKKRAEVLGNQIISIVPQSYKDVHILRQSQVLNFKDQMKKAQFSVVVHSQRKLPIRVSDFELIMGIICIKYEVDILKGLSFISIIKRSRQKSQTVLLSLNGQVFQKQRDFCDQILQHGQFKKYLSSAKKRWEEQKLIKQESFNIMMNSTSYAINISSPLTSLFLEKKQLIHYTPPLHVQIHNQDGNKKKKIQSKSATNIVGKLKQYQQQIVRIQGSQSTTSSSKSSSSAVNVLTNFTQNSTMPIYKNIFIAFFACLSVCLTVTLVGNYGISLGWDNFQSKNNPFWDTIYSMSLQRYTTGTLLYLSDKIAYEKYQNVYNKTLVNSYFGYDDYSTQMDNFLLKLVDNYTSILYTAYTDSSVALGQILQQKVRNAQFTINDNSNDNTFGAKASQNMTYIQLILSYCTDIHIITKNTFSEQIMLFKSFDKQLSDRQNVTYLINFISQKISDCQSTNISLQLPMFFLVILLVIPLAFILKKRLIFHQKIFDLIVSLDSQFIVKQLRSLNYVVNILKNYQETSQILKINVMGYQQKLLIPKNRKSQGSVDNQIIIGLQKYDTPHLQQQSQVKRISINSEIKQKSSNNLENSLRSNSIRQTVKENQLNNQLTKIRKRSGELDLTASHSDPNCKIIPHHIVLYVLILIFGVFVISSILYNNTYYSGLNAFKQKIITKLDLIIQQNYFFLMSKIYLRNGFNVPMKFSQQQAYNSLVQYLKILPIFDYSKTQNYQIQIKQCSMKAVKKPLFCNHNYTFRIIRQQFYSLVKQLYQWKYNLDAQYTNRSNPQYVKQINKISQKLFYIQSVYSEVISTSWSVMQGYIFEMMIFSGIYATNKNLIFYLSILWIVISFVIGFSVIYILKRQYFIQAYMITFLNNQMAFRNKRVESFLSSLSKSSIS